MRRWNRMPVGAAGAAARLRVRVRPPPLRLRRLGLQPEGRRQRPQLARRVHDDPGLPGGGRHRRRLRGSAGVPVPVHDRPQAGPVQPRRSATGCGASSSRAGCCSPTTATTTSTGSTRRASSRRCGRSFRGRGQRCRSCPARHPHLSLLLHVRRRPPTTSHELNGWGDDIVHDYLRGVEHRGRLGVLYSNKDYGCEWDYDWRNKRFQREDNTKFAVNIVVYAFLS